MDLSDEESALARIGIADKKTIKLFEEGIHWSRVTSRTIDDLTHQVCADRLRLADHFLETGNRLMKARPKQYRSAISRYYYAMYHAARAIVYLDNRGDDHQEHSKLPGKIPDDFNDSSVWQNALKDARGYRNDADYDPYPILIRSWRDPAQSLATQAPELVRLAREYLKAKGCAHL